MAYRIANRPAGPGPFAAEAYDATGMLLHTLASGEVTRAGVEAHIDNLRWTGVTGLVAFDADGEPEVRLRLSQVRSGRFAPVGVLP